MLKTFKRTCTKFICSAVGVEVLSDHKMHYEFNAALPTTKTNHNNRCNNGNKSNKLPANANHKLLKLLKTKKKKKNNFK